MTPFILYLYLHMESNTRFVSNNSGDSIPNSQSNQDIDWVSSFRYFRIMYILRNLGFFQ